jgi:hypothetical protein
MSAASGSTEMQILNVETQSADAHKRKFSWADVKSRITLETVVIALIVCAIIVFTSFQISESVTAHKEPSTKVSILEKARLFPGMLICPYGRNRLAVFNGVENQRDEDDPNPFCPQWSDDAFMSFEFGTGPVTNTNFTPNFLNFNSVGTQKRPLQYLGSATRYATIKNKPVLQKIKRDICLQENPGNPQRCSEDACNSWAPPNVRCTVYDPFEFDKSENADPTLNPMRETIANGVDSLYLQEVVYDFERGIRTSGFRYSGLIKQPAFSPVFGEDVPSNALLSLFDYRELLRKKTLANERILQTSLFSGVMLVFYNPFNGIPKELDFTSAPEIFGSDLFTVGLLKSGRDTTKPCCEPPQAFDVRKEDPRAVSVSVHFHQAYSDAIRGAYREPKASYSFSSTPILKETFEKLGNRGDQPELDIKFTSSVSTFTQDVVSLSVLTSISIILTTSATLWGSQEKIKEFILFCIAKYNTNQKAHLSDKDAAI